MTLNRKACAAVLLNLATFAPTYLYAFTSTVEVKKNVIPVQQNSAPLQFIAHKWRAFYQPQGGDRLAYTISFTQTGQATFCIAPERYPNTCQGLNYFNFSAAGDARVGGSLQISYQGVRGEVCRQGCMPTQRPADYTGRISILSAGEFTDDAGLKWTKLPEAF